MVISSSIARAKKREALITSLFSVGYDSNVMQGCLKKVTKY